jgi:methylenetetrahydrofolate dehydrogenase (NADP+)/methenyltetrahydrofolate cyclohydrolase
MTAQIISGKEISSVMRDEIKEEVSGICQKNAGNVAFVPPGLAVIQVGENPSSTIYVNNKKKACEAAGIKSFSYSLDADASEKDLIQLIEVLNSDPNVHGILCQLPLPAHMDEFTAISAILPEKDVDGFHPVNKGLLSV